MRVVDTRQEAPERSENLRKSAVRHRPILGNESTMGCDAKYIWVIASNGIV